MQNDFDLLVPRAQIAKEFGICHQTVRRWEAAKVPGFDERVEIQGRIYHRRSCIERAKLARNSAA
jgi:CENP-B N-terminal DNA-binding domain